MNPTLLSQIASLPGPAPGVAGARTCYWHAGAKNLELHTLESPVSRVAAIACGAALHQAQIALAANGFSGVMRAGRPGDDLFATITPVGQHSTTAHDLAMYQALVQGTASDPPADAADTAALISHAVWPYGVRVQVIDDNTARFLDAMAHIPARENAQCLALVTATDSPSDWVNAGQALSAAMLTARLAGLSANVDDVLEVRGRRALVRSLVTPDGQPQILLALLRPGAPLL